MLLYFGFDMLIIVTDVGTNSVTNRLSDFFFFFWTGFINVILREIQDNLPSLLDSALRMLLQLLGQWKTALTAGSANVQVRVAKLMSLST